MFRITIERSKFLPGATEAYYYDKSDEYLEDDTEVFFFLLGIRAGAETSAYITLFKKLSNKYPAEIAKLHMDRALQDKIISKPDRLKVTIQKI